MPSRRSLDEDKYIAQSIKKNKLEELNTIDDVDTDLCDVCNDGYSYEDNDIMFCEKCNVAVHKNCQELDSIPSGDW